MTQSPAWLTDGAPHVWRPYCQMKTAPAPLAVARTEGARIILDDGRELVDGIASWWTACHGYNHPHILAALRGQPVVLLPDRFGKNRAVFDYTSHAYSTVHWADTPAEALERARALAKDA